MRWNFFDRLYILIRGTWLDLRDAWAAWRRRRRERR